MNITDYHKEIGARGAAIARAKKAQGETVHLAPYGYRNARDAEGRSVIEPDPTLLPLLQEAWHMRSQGVSVRKICREMHARGL